ncbi:MAG: class I SAM-dependent methyltransferase, partial [Proteobacteria bacterium]|nr:class I SAM-dependent methyltransferase [Pseudomonadota bacterium]
PAGRQVTALEPSLEMIRQRGSSTVNVIQGYAEDLPFDDNAFDASMAVNTIHHWADKEKGLREMRRVTRGPVVILTSDSTHRGCWLTDYIPELVTLDEGQMPRLTDYEAGLGPVEISPVPVPHDCSDGFLYAYWRRPRAYLDPKIRAAMSSFYLVGDVSGALEKLSRDVRPGAWARRHADLLDLETYDVGYRLVTAN